MLWDHDCALHYSVYIDLLTEVQAKNVRLATQTRQQGKTRVNIGGAFTRGNI